MGKIPNELFGLPSSKWAEPTRLLGSCPHPPNCWKSCLRTGSGEGPETRRPAAQHDVWYLTRSQQGAPGPSTRSSPFPRFLPCCHLPLPRAASRAHSSCSSAPSPGLLPCSSRPVFFSCPTGASRGPALRAGPGCWAE